MSRAGIFASAHVPAAAGGGIVSVVRVYREFIRQTATTHSRSVTFDSAYDSSRWLVGLTMRRSTSDGIDTTVNASPVTEFDFTSAGGAGWSAWVAQPTSDPSCTVAWETTTTVAEQALIVYEVRSATQPVLVDAGSEGASLLSVSTPAGGAVMGAVLQTSSTAPSSDTVGLTLGASSAGWFLFEGSDFPTATGTAGFDPVNTSGYAFSIL